MLTPKQERSQWARHLWRYHKFQASEFPSLVLVRNDLIDLHYALHLDGFAYPPHEHSRDLAIANEEDVTGMILTETLHSYFRKKIDQVTKNRKRSAAELRQRLLNDEGPIEEDPFPEEKYEIRLGSEVHSK